MLALLPFMAAMAAKQSQIELPRGAMQANDWLVASTTVTVKSDDDSEWLPMGTVSGACKAVYRVKGCFEDTHYLKSKTRDLPYALPGCYKCNKAEKC